jgi:alpha-ketoglutarate-dependent 2,4-dichlorophenoxyacetate dioxygenase
MTINIQPEPSGFGAVISGPDLTKPIDDATYSAIRAAFEEYSVLVFHNQPFTDETQVAFGERFGPLEVVTKTRVGGGGGDLIADISNVDRASDTILPIDGEVMVYRSGNEMWHTDSSFRDVPAMASMLSGREVPPDGGETEFVSMRAAYKRLDPARQAELEGLVAVHDYTYSRALVGSVLSPAQQKELPPAKQIVVRTNPANGEKNYFTASHASHIVGWPEEKGRDYMKDLVALATRPEDIYTHKWRQHDLVIWDNRCTLHRGRVWEKSRYRRIMRRTTVAGDGPTVPAE